MEKEITLIEALTGVDFILVHLDGRKIRIKNNVGEIIKPDDVKTCEHLGMPYHKKVYMSGNLLIHFKIKFPTAMEPKSISLIQEALGGHHAASGKGSTKNAHTAKGKGAAEETKASQEVDEEVIMKQFEEFHRNAHHGGGDKGNDSEEEEEDGHGHG
jgi:DnaJ-class molecular chaperone